MSTSRTSSTSSTTGAKGRDIGGQSSDVWTTNSTGAYHTIRAGIETRDIEARTEGQRTRGHGHGGERLGQEHL